MSVLAVKSSSYFAFEVDGIECIDDCGDLGKVIFSGNSECDNTSSEIIVFICVCIMVSEILKYTH